MSDAAFWDSSAARWLELAAKWDGEHRVDALRCAARCMGDARRARELERKLEGRAA